MIKYPKRIIKKDTPIKDRYLGVLLEDINGKFDLLIEGHQVLVKNQETLNKDFGSFHKEADEKFALVLKRFNIVDDRFRSVDDRFRSLEKNAEDFQKETTDNFQAVFKYLSHINQEMQLQKNAEWEKRISRLEELILRRPGTQ